MVSRLVLFRAVLTVACVRWIGCGGSQYAFPDALKADYGVPLSTCEETGPNTGVFTRVYSNAKVRVASGRRGHFPPSVWVLVLLGTRSVFVSMVSVCVDAPRFVWV